MDLQGFEPKPTNQTEKVLGKRKTESLTVPTGINQIWSMDFMHDQLQVCRTFRLFNLIYDFHHEALAVEIELSQLSTSDQLTEPSDFLEK